MNSQCESNPQVAASALAAGSKYRLVLIGCDVMKDHCMHAADLFERWKVLIEPILYADGTIQEGQTLASVIVKTREALARQPDRFRMIAVFHPHIEEGAWCDREVVMVSTGYEFFKFADYLTAQHYVGPLPKRYPDEKL